MTDNFEEPSSDASSDKVDSGTEEPQVVEPVPGSPEALQLALAEKEKQLAEQQQKYLYLYAEFDNFKKRSIRERSDLVKFGNESFARELLPVADNFERALQYTNNIDALVTGIKMVATQLNEVFAKYAVVPILSVGQKFDPMLHEAVGQEPAAEDKPEGTVTVEHEKGYTLNGRLLRPAKVIVAVAK